MKRICLTLAAILLSVSIFAQSPYKMSYQSIVRDNAGNVIADQPIGIQISIIQQHIDGDIVYAETHMDTTNSFGLINLIVGDGEVQSGDFELIDWGQEPYFIKIEIDEEGGNNYQTLAVTQLLSVPYALYANEVKNKDDADADATNELQNLQFADSTLSISSGNSVKIPTSYFSPWKRNVNDIYYNNGNTGIGTKSPEFKLHIEDSINEGTSQRLVFINNKANTLKSFSGISLQAGQNTTYTSLAQFSEGYSAIPGMDDFAQLYNSGKGIALTTSPTGIIKFMKNDNTGTNTELIRIISNGNIGIGVIDPESALTIIKDESGYGEDGRVFLTLRNTSNSDYSNVALRLFSGSDTCYTTLNHTSHTYYNPTLRGYGILDSYGNGLVLRSKSSYGVIKFILGNAFPGNISDEYERMRIDANGNVGIGTKDPKAKLQISDGDVYIEDVNKGIIMKSPDGQCWRVTVENGGGLTSTSVTCP